MAIVTRFLLGFLNGILGTIKAYACELFPEEYQALGLSATSTSWGIGLVIGPALGGYLAQPAEKFPSLVSLDSLFGRFPYLLPCLCISIFALVVTIVAIWLPETLHIHKLNELESASDAPVAKEKANEEKDSTLLSLLKNWPLMSSIIVYCVFSLYDTAYTEIFSLWAESPKSLGGLNYTSDDVGVVLSVTGVCLLLFHTAFFPIAVRIFGPVMVARISGVLSIPLLTAYPYIALLSGLMLTFTLNLASILKNVLSISIITGTVMLQNKAVDQHQRGAANGIAMTLQATFNAIGPSCGGALLSWSLKRQNATFLPGKTLSLDPNISIVVPEDRDGLYAIDCLDPAMVIGRSSVCYFHDMINEMTSWGYQEGKTLFGFGYDFRQSNRLQETLDRLAAKLDAIYTASGEKKINVITHSMGGLLVKCFMSLHSDSFEKYVKSWIAIAAPFQGAPGYVTSTLMNGMSFVDGWEAYFFVSKWSMHQLLIECPSIYELMACLDHEWEHVPLLQIWKEIQDGNGSSKPMLETFTPIEAVSIFTQALSMNELSYGGVDIPLPFNKEILQWANKTREILSSAKLPPSVKFYNVYGTGLDTPQSVCYGSADAPILDLQELPLVDATYINVNGDGTVPVESSKADGLDAEARVGIPGEHRGILCDKHLFRIVKHWLKADHDPFYNPVNDYVILPTLFEIEKHSDSKGKEVTSVKEEWEIVSEDEREAMVGSISATCVGDDLSSEEAHATFIVHPQSNGKQHIELNAMSVTAGV